MFVNTTVAALLSFCASYFQCTFATIIHDGLSEVLQSLEAELHQTFVVETRRLARLNVSRILSMTVPLQAPKRQPHSVLCLSHSSPSNLSQPLHGDWVNP